MSKNLMKNHTVLITGASSGIGKACAEEFANLGANLVITGRRMERLEAVAKDLSSHYEIKCLPLQLDVRNFKHVETVFTQLEQQHIHIDILINNAGLALAIDKLQDGQVENWDTMIDTNLKGLLYMTRVVLPSMIKKNHGHIVNIGSVAGHDCYPAGNVYCATKHAVRAITKSLRIDLHGTAIRVTEIDPGAVETEFSEVRLQDKEKAKKVYTGFQSLVATDIADAVIYCVTRPQHVNISEMVIYPQAQSSIREIYKQEKTAPPRS